jgi:replication factor C subunit 2/4
LQSNNLPHLLFYGPPGTGKTSTILALARDLFGPNLIKNRLLELNASDERGIDVIREKVKLFAKISVSGGKDAEGTSTTGSGDYPCPPFKLIVLDEADSLTTDAQTALRRLMEQYARSTRFCLICNYVSRIIDPLTSRCAKFRFKPIAEAAGITRLSDICQAEKVNVQDDHVLRELLSISNGDLRRAITLLQSCHRLGLVTVELIRSFGGILPPDIPAKALALCQEPPAAHLSHLNDFVTREIIRAAHGGQQFVRQFMQLLLSDSTISNMKKSMVALKCAHADAAMGEGADEYLQVLSLLANCQRIFTLSPGSQELPAF